MAIDDILNRSGWVSYPDPFTDGQVERFTQDVANALLPGEKYKFVITANMPEYKKPDVKPSDFKDRNEYRRYLYAKRREFMQLHSAKTKDIMDKLGIKDSAVLSIGLIVADLTKDQYESLKNSGLAGKITADYMIKQ